MGRLGGGSGAARGLAQAEQCWHDSRIAKSGAFDEEFQGRRRRRAFSICVEHSVGCSGSEPFWSLAIGGAAPSFKRALSDPPSERDTWSLKAVTPRKAQNRSLEVLRVYDTQRTSFRRTPMTVLIEGQKCVDLGESEYAYSVIIMTKTDVYSGCCTLKK